MKKIFVLFVLGLFILAGCGMVTEENIIKEFEKKVANSNSYTLDGTMQIISNEEKFDYNIQVNYLKNNYYKVILVNQNNNHEQIILRNDDGVYVVTPALNKSFKFQSEWPDNSSQAYILGSLLKDLNNTKDVKYEKNDDGYILTSDVVYPNNSALKYQKIYFDKNVNVVKVEVYNNDDNPSITVVFTKSDYKSNLNPEDFALENFVKKDCCKTNEENCNKECKNNEQEKEEMKSANLDSAIYPLYVPEKSSLTSSEKIETDYGSRLILTFAGETDFILVEETSKVYNDLEVIPVYGDPHILNSSVVALGANSLYWTDNNIDFYLASNSLSGEEMLTIASSMANSQIVSQTK